MVSMEQLIRMAAAGHNVLIVRDRAQQLSCKVDKGRLFIRSFAASGLKSVSVDTVVLVGDVPSEVAQLAKCRSNGFLNSQVFEAPGEKKMLTTEGILRVEDLQTELGDGYVVNSLETEVYREYTLPNGNKYRIDNPQFLIVRKGGSTHRVVCEGGLTHCIPWGGSTTVVWQNHDPLDPCEF